MTVIPDPNAVATWWSHISRYPSVVLYVGPDQIMPLTSILGALVGVALMFWNRLVGLFHKLFARRVEDPNKQSES